MCDGTCSLCGKYNDNLESLTEGILICHDTINCPNIAPQRKLSEWKSGDFEIGLKPIFNSFQKTDIHGKIKANICRKDNKFFCNVDSGNSVIIFQVQPTEMMAKNWCDCVLYELGYII